MERERSPNYPAYPLGIAVEFARQVYGNVKRVAVPMEALARALGSSGLSGPARSKIAALRAYGLLESAKEGFKISERAMTLILSKPGDSKFHEAARAAVLSPALFAELASERAVMDDEHLQFYLVRDKGFSEDGARRAIKSFRDSVALAGLDGADAFPGTPEATPKETPMAATVLVPPVPFGQPATAPSSDLVLEVPGVFSARIAFKSGVPSADEIDTVIAFLKLVKPISKGQSNTAEHAAKPDEAAGGEPLN